MNDAKNPPPVRKIRRQDSEISKKRPFREPSREVDERAHAVIGAAIEVHRHLGPGHLELMYRRALAIEMRLRGIPFAVEAPASLSYKGEDIGEFRIDLLVGEALIVELKAVETLASIHVVQVLSYLEVTGLELGLLLNFNVPTLIQGIKRVVPRQR